MLPVYSKSSLGWVDLLPVQSNSPSLVVYLEDHFELKPGCDNLIEDLHDLQGALAPTISRSYNSGLLISSKMSF